MPRSLLLIEDSEDDVFFFQVAMRKLELTHLLVVARDGREGLQRLQESVSGTMGGGPFDLVLLDLKLPYVNGLEVLAWMQSLPPGLRPPVVVLTTSEKESEVQLASRLGAAAVLLKPNRSEQLVELLRALDAQWLRATPTPPSPILATPPLQPAGLVR